MPINNNLFGVYKTLLVDGQVVLASRASRSQEMEVSQKQFIQGTPKNRILDIGGVSETITISAPVLIGGAQTIDGRSLILKKLNEIISNPFTATLPILKSASISISESGADTSITLLSDGDPSVITNLTNAPFEVVSTQAEYLPNDPLNPITKTPSRVARFYDFRVSILGKVYYIIEASLNIQVNTEQKYFIGAYVTATNVTESGGDGEAVINTLGTKINSGSQFPTIGVSGIQISGSGKAAALLRNLNEGLGDPADYDFNDYNTVQDDAADEAINVNLGTGLSDLNLQKPGKVVYDDTGLQIEVFKYTNNSGTGSWESLLTYNNTAVVDLRRAVINKANFNVEPGMLTIDFDFTCWVK